MENIDSTYNDSIFDSQLCDEVSILERGSWKAV